MSDTSPAVNGHASTETSAPASTTAAPASSTSSDESSNGSSPSKEEGFLASLLPWGGKEGRKGKEEGSVTHPSEISPFLGARRYMDSRIDQAVQSKHQFMVIALVASLAAALAISGLVYLSTTSRVEPWMIVYSDKTGQLLYSGDIKPIDSVPELATKRHLEEVLEGLRTVYTDRRATSKDFLEAYAFIGKGSEADAYLRDFFARTGENPVQQVGDVQRSISEMEVGKIAGTRSWDLRWVEREVQGNGEVIQTVWLGSFSVTRSQNTDPEKNPKNPTGIYVDGISWQQVSSEVLSGQPPVSND